MSDPVRFVVDFTPAAIDDLAGIVEYLTEKGASGPARALVLKFRERTDALAEFPRRGNIPREIEGLSAGEVRQILVSPYRILYEISGDRVFVHLIADGRRDIRRLLPQRLIAARARGEP